MIDQDPSMSFLLLGDILLATYTIKGITFSLCIKILVMYLLCVYWNGTHMYEKCNRHEEVTRRGKREEDKKTFFFEKVNCCKNTWRTYVACKKAMTHIFLLTKVNKK